MLIDTLAPGDQGRGAGLAGEVRSYLARSPRQLPSRALYDTLGSALFDAICELPWYPLTRAERRLLAARRDNILRDAGSPSRIVELGPGNGSKLELLLGEATHSRYVHRIELVDVSASALRDAARRVSDGRPVTVLTHQMRYEDGLAALRRTPLPGERTLVLFLGSNIGNFDPEGAATFLGTVRAALADDDAFLMGVDLVKPERQLQLAYDDPLGVTAAFNKNLLLHLNRELGATFNVDAFEHRAVWNEGASRMEMHLVSRFAQHVDIPGAALSLQLRARETIWTESSYKYRLEDVERLLARSGLASRQHWVDDEGQFLLTLVGPHER